ncbi:P-loop containing nucleoside triphosphate hydrolase protein [Agrocybe pediades]|nr:P-loop containing nucleoside triphosphate hydrolase protein [Agrocybe pediades]
MPDAKDLLQKETNHRSSDVGIRERQYGVWKFKVAGHSTLKSPQQRWHDFASSLPFLRRLFRDAFGVAPLLLVLFIFSEVIGGIDSTLTMYFSNQLLQTVEAWRTTGQIDGARISRAILSRVLCVLLLPYFHTFKRWISSLLELHVKRHFQLMILESELKMDLKASERTKGLQGATPDKAWTALEESIGFIQYITKAIGQSFLIFQLSRTSGGPIFMLLCICGPITSLFRDKSFFNYVALYFVNDIYYQKMLALKKFCGKEYRQDVISGNLGSWILSEMKKSYDGLSHIPSSDKHPVRVYMAAEQSTVLARSWNAFISLLSDFPMIYSAFKAWKNPSAVSIAGLAILQQSMSTLTSTAYLFVHSLSRFQESLDSLRSVYALADISLSNADLGQKPYPSPSIDSLHDVSKGMSLELRGVTLSYPGEETKAPALRNVSLKIPAGHLVVIVGANGSGKSTLVRVVTRLYDPTEGELLIDGRLAKDYRSKDLQEATAVLSQDNKLYPFTLAENIGLGCPDFVQDEEAILAAASKGGAINVIQNLKDGLQTQLDPSLQLHHIKLVDKPHHPLYAEMERLQKTTDVSGGEKQKIVASRTFMRFNSGKVKLVAVDEPSSALDAEAELDLFNNLIAGREGKTLLMVTHRFGHLTKHADMIICMKNGEIVECGTHKQLMEVQGEYANLYNIQAHAFQR